MAPRKTVTTTPSRLLDDGVGRKLTTWYLSPAARGRGRKNLISSATVIDAGACSFAHLIVWAHFVRQRAARDIRCALAPYILDIVCEIAEGYVWRGGIENRKA